MLNNRPPSSDSNVLYKQLLRTDANDRGKRNQIPFLPHSPYNRPLTTISKVDKSSLLWRDFTNAVKRRKRLLNHIRKVAQEENESSNTLKRLFLDLRQLTLKIIEDALEIEYSSQFGDIKFPVKSNGIMQLPPLASFRGLEGKEEVVVLAEIITDTDDLYKLPNVQAFLPTNFPHTRNPFLLGKNVDELAIINNPSTEPGNINQELKALELLRYKRAAKTIIKAEAQVLNKMPVSLEDIELLWTEKNRDSNKNSLIRVMLTLLDEDNRFPSNRGPQLRYLVDKAIYVESAEFLHKLSQYDKHKSHYSVDVLSAVRHVLRNCVTSTFTDIASSFFVEWLKVVLNDNKIFFAEDQYMMAPQPAKHTDAPREPAEVLLHSVSESELQNDPVTNSLLDGPNEEKNSIVAGSETASPGKKKRGVTKPKQQSPSKSESIHSSSIYHPRTHKTKDNSSKNVKADVSLESFNLLKYEILKMQQELLRRKVLDPRHYVVSNNNIKNLAASDFFEKQAATQESSLVSNSNKEMPAKTQLDSLHYDIILVEPINLNRVRDGLIQLSVDAAKEFLFVCFKCKNIYNADDVDEVSAGDSCIAKSDFSIEFDPLNRLFFDQLTGIQLDNILEIPEKLRRTQLSGFLLQVKVIVENMVKTLSFPAILSHSFTLLLAKDVLKSGNAAIEVTVERAIENDGLLLVARQSNVANSVDRKNNQLNSLSVFIHDKELLVLLINQRGLFVIAFSKWSCMEMIAQWLLSRTRVRRIAHESESSSELTELRSLLEIYVDRTIDISEDVKIDWRSKNIPSLNGITINVVMKAWQDLEMMVIEVGLKMAYVSPEYLERKRRAKELFDFENSQLIEFTSPYNDAYDKVNFEESVDERDRFKSHTLSLTISLTGTELLIFGTGETIETKRALAQTRSAQAFNPNTFMKNVLGRLSIIFEGNKEDPLNPSNSCIDNSKWLIKYNRRLFRDVRTISGGVMVIVASAIGSEILFESKPTDYSIYTEVCSKLFEVSEIEEIVLTEGWKADILDPGNRVTLALRILEKLKVVFEGDKHRLEFYSFPETRILQVASCITINKNEILIGNVEINSNHTLQDLRVIISNELDKDLLPRQFRFIYKGVSCSLKQEPFRKAWDCFPKVLISGKSDRDIQKTNDTPEQAKEAIAQRMSKKARKEEEDREKNRQLSKKLVPVPLLTLCKIREGDCWLYTRHDMRDVLSPGDVLRIGHPLSSDFMVSFSFASILSPSDEERNGLENVSVGPLLSPIKKIPIEPSFDIFGEKELIIKGNIGCDSRSQKMKKEDNEKKSLMKGKERRHSQIEAVPSTESTGVSAFKEKPRKNSILATSRRASVVSVASVASLPASDDGEESVPPILEPLVDMTMYDLKSQFTYIDATESASVSQKKYSVTSANSNNSGRKGSNTDIEEFASRIEKPTEKGETFVDIWIWKCIPRGEDKRPKWRQLYDNGMIPYQLTHQNRDDGPTHFRIKAPWRLLEVLCRDFRCPEMSPFAQRVHEMTHVSIDYYSQLAFIKICKWLPVSDGVTQDKFLKLITDIDIFPDIKKPARIVQLESAFFKEVNGSNGNETCVNYTGFCCLLMEVCLIRFPPGLFDLSDAESAMNDEFKVSESTRQLFEQKLEKKNELPSPPRANKKNEQEKGKSKKKINKQPIDSNLFSTVEPKHAFIAYRTLVVDYVGTVAEWADEVWEKCKLFAMEKESLRYCAATKLISHWRKYSCLRLFKIFRRGLTLFQAQIRQRQMKRRTQLLLNKYHQDWLYRLRYNCAALVQSSVRRYLCRCRFIQTINKIREKELVILRTRRARMSKIRQKERKAIIFKQIRQINGVMVLIVIKRKDQRSYSTDFGMILTVYTPKWQEIISFIIEETQLRSYISEVTQSVALSVGDLLNRNNLEKVISARLICRKAKREGAPPKIILSRQSLGQQGPEMLTKGRCIDKELFACTLYETGYDITVQCYHQRTSKIFTCNILQSAVQNWVTEVYRAGCNSDIEKQQQPPLLRAERKRELHVWLINNIVVDKRHGTFQVLFACQLSKSKKLEAIIKIQSLWRRAIVRTTLPGLLDYYYMKIKSNPFDDTCYYLNIYTGTSDWSLPKLLKPHQDIPTQPSYRWVYLPYYTGSTLYVNPFTGKYTHLDYDRATKLLQAMVRNWFLRPFKLPFDLFKKGVLFEKSCKQVYENDKTRLASVINYACVTFTVFIDYKLTRQLLLDALHLADTNPLTTRLYALFLLATCEAPVSVTREKANELLRDSARRDPYNHKFETAFNCFFKYACYRQPRSSGTLLHLGLAQFYIYHNLEQAEICLRRAVSISPFDTNVMENWKLLQLNFPERRLLYRPRGQQEKLSTNLGAKKMMVHGRSAIYDPGYAGWVFIERDPMYKDWGMEHWYNPATGERREDPPEDFQKEWFIRVDRSSFEGIKDGLEHYYDPLTSTYFQRHILTNTFQ